MLEAILISDIGGRNMSLIEFLDMTIRSVERGSPEEYKIPHSVIFGDEELHMEFLFELDKLPVMDGVKMAIPTPNYKGYSIGLNKELDPEQVYLIKYFVPDSGPIGDTPLLEQEPQFLVRVISA